MNGFFSFIQSIYKHSNSNVNTNHIRSKLKFTEFIDNFDTIECDNYTKYESTLESLLVHARDTAKKFALFFNINVQPINIADLLIEAENGCISSQYDILSLINGRFCFQQEAQFHFLVFYGIESFLLLDTKVFSKQIRIVKDILNSIIKFDVSRMIETNLFIYSSFLVNSREKLSSFSFFEEIFSLSILSHDNTTKKLAEDFYIQHSKHLKPIFQSVTGFLAEVQNFKKEDFRDFSRKLLKVISEPKSATSLSCDVKVLLNACNQIPELGKVSKRWTWTEFVGQNKIKERLVQVLSPEMDTSLSRFSIKQMQGILIKGDSGFGKSCLLNEITKNLNEVHQIKVITVNATDVLSQYLGDSERNLRNIFQEARKVYPSCVIFDDLDSVFEGKDTFTHRLVTTLLNELDGIEDKRKPLFVGSVRSVEGLSKALLRPGRIDTVIELSLPGVKDISKLLKYFMPDKYQINHDKVAITLNNVFFMTKWTPGRIKQLVLLTKIRLLKERIEGKEMRNTTEDIILQIAKMMI